MSRVVVKACEAAVKFYDYGVTNDERYEKAYTELERHVAAALADVEFPKAPRGRQFNYVPMFDSFASDLATALGGDEQVLKMVDHILWSAMPDAYTEWHRLLREPADDYDPEEESLEDAADRAALEFFSSSCAYGMHQISLWHKAREQASQAGQVVP
jgi:hypothetical protein